MRWPLKFLLLAFAAAVPAAFAAADVQSLGATRTVCTITVNSADEKDVFRRYLPAAKYKFVELVEKGRPDWLASACQAGVSCDVLIISGHYDGGNEFFSDQLASHEFLPVDELERVSCSDSCPGLFSKLKEVHLFGCDTLNAGANSSVSADVVRSLVREGRSPKDAERQWRTLNAGHGASSRDRMRQVFKDVPVIYGFSSVAPLGPTAAATLSSYFRGGGAREIGQGRASGRLLAQFAPFGLTATQGMTDQDPGAAVRRDVCRFADERVPDANKLGFIHQLLQRPTAEARVHLDRIQRYTTALDSPARRTPQVTQALASIAGDGAVRARFLDFARDADQPEVRARMLTLARDLGWLKPNERWSELALMLRELHARSAVGVTEVDLACRLNAGHELDGTFERSVDGLDSVKTASASDDLPHAALRACIGSTEGRARTLAGLLSQRVADVQIAQAYLRQRLITDATELRRLAVGIAGMEPSDAQVRALETVGRQYVSDRETLDRLTRLYSETSSRPVQAAIAGILIRADLRSIGSTPLVQILQKDRRESPPGDDVIDALIRRLQAS